MAREPLTFKRLAGLDRSGPPPPETQPGAPLNPWTIPNAIGYARAVLIPVFLAVALSDDDGRTVDGAVIFAVIAWSDYADGIAARVTGQYSRLGTLLDPIVDRLLVISGVVVCWHFELLPRWALAVLAIREVAMLGLSRAAMSRGVDIRINWWGRWGVWPIMSAPFLAMVSADDLAEGCLYFGLVLVLVATAMYVRDGVRAAPSRPG